MPPEDRKSKPFPRIQSDDARAVAGKRRTPPQGFPVYVDPELTPPPQMPPIAPGDDIREQLRLLAIGLGQNTEAIGKVWAERGNGERIVDLEKAVLGFTGQVARHQQTLDDFLVPGVKDLMAASEHAGRALVKADTLLDQSGRTLTEISTTLKDLVTRIGRLESSVDNLHTKHETLTDDLDALSKRVTIEVEKLDARVTKIETKALVSHVESAQISRWFSWGKAALVGGVAAATAIVSNLDDIVRWFT